MIEHLYIENVVLIEKINIEFNKGLNILSGETGVGKSIIMDSIAFAMGNRPKSDFVKKNTEKALVEVLVSINNDFVVETVKNYGIDVADDNTILISRSLNLNGKSVCKINGKTITVSMLKEIASLVIDIHGQHESQSLMNPAKHIYIIDKFCGEIIDEYKAELLKKYREYKSVLKSLQNIDGNARERKIKEEDYRNKIREIELAKLKPNEEEELASKRAVLSNSEKLKDYTDSVLSILYRDESGAVSDGVSYALDNLFKIAELDPEQEKVCEMLEGVVADISDIVSQLSDYSDNIESNKGEIERIDERLDFIYGLKRRYGKDVNGILKYYDELKGKLDFLINSQDELIRLTEKKKSIETEIKRICDLISEERITTGKGIQINVEKALQDLGMKNSKFEIAFSKRDDFTTNGRDKAEFLISTNVGEDLKPLAKVASGGEMSRVMLALKTVLAKADTTETFIFDEIDTGVSGRAAQQVAQKLSELGKTHQILCITHLPQIAAMGDSHFLIEKISDLKSTRTTICKLDYKRIINEIARLTGGAKITEATIKAAEDMKRLAINLK